MAYIRIGEDKSTFGSFGCGPGCGCAGCQRTAGSLPGLGERYVPEEEEDAPPPRTPPQPEAPPPAHLTGWGRFGEPPLRRRPLPTNGVRLRMPAFETITGFPRGGASLSAAQLERVNRVAEFVAQSWNGASPITSIRITGYIDADEWQSDLGERRAVAVRDALLRALGSARPGLATRLQWILEDRGFSPVAKVEIYLWHGPTPPPVPPLVRLPSPAEAARTVAPMRPETPEERIQRILRTLPPPPPPRRTFSEAFWQRVDEHLNSAMNRLGVPSSLRGPIRNGARAAIRRGSEELMKRILDASGLPSEAQEAIRGTVRGAAELKVP